MKAHAFFAVFVMMAATVSTRIAHASGPIGVYALVDSVTFEPGGDKPERIRISGVFITALPTPDNSTVYSAPQRGYLYFELPKSNGELARREWADLQTIAGTRQVVGFGASWLAQVRVLKPGEQSAMPSEYPMGNGVAKINSDQVRAKALLDYQGR